MTSISTGPVRNSARLALGAMLVVAGALHLTIARQAFRSQVPSWFPLDEDFVVVASGVVEIVLGAAVAAIESRRVLLGWVTAAFFVAVFPGNISQFITHSDAFGLESDTARFVRLLFQPALVVWALWSTGAWRDTAMNLGRR